MQAIPAASADVIQCLEAILAGDFTVEPVGDDDISTTLRKVVEKLRSTTQADMGRVVSLSVQANETAIFSADLLGNFRKMDQQAQAIAAATEEMVATVKSIGVFGENILAQARGAEASVQSGAQSSSRAVATMEQIERSVTQAVDKVNVLEKFSGRISSISQDIKKIADQTNLLALNATIEAARAGEAGKGFAVVAGEVKHLSGQTRKATEEINGIVQQLQKEMEAVSQAMISSSEAVRTGHGAIEEVNGSMQDIQAQIESVRRNTAQISDTLAEQAHASQDVAKSLAAIAVGSSKGVQGIEHIIAAMDAVEKLISAQILHFAEMTVPNKVVKLAQSDHVLWKKRLANMIIGREGLKAGELADHHSCRLGKWYDQVEDTRYTRHGAFGQLVGPHKSVHEHGILAVRLFNEGKTEEALQEIGKVEEASKEVLRLLSEIDRLSQD